MGLFKVDFFICQTSVGPYKMFLCQNPKRTQNLELHCEEICQLCNQRVTQAFLGVYAIKYNPGDYVIRGYNSLRKDFPNNTFLDKVFYQKGDTVFFVSGEKERYDKILKMVGRILNPEKAKKNKIERNEFLFNYRYRAVILE
jgi:hypothetical protein